jgi:tetratricopeptide (TPR) repeat protein
VQLHRETLARAKVHEDSGQFERGLELVAEVLTDAKALAYEPLVAEAYLHKGCIESWTDRAESVRSLSEALWAALANGHTFVAARASSKRGQVMSSDRGQQAKDDLPMIVALNRRIVNDPVAYAEYLNDVGMIHLNVLDAREARRWFEAARDLRVARGLPVDWRVLSTLMNLGHVTKYDKRTLEAVEIYRDIVRQAKEIAPSTHVMYVAFSASLAQAWTDAGRPFDAVGELRQCQTKFALLEGLPSYQRYMLSLNLGEVSRLIGDVSAARAHLSEAQVLCPGGPTCRSVLVQLMLTAAAEGDAAAVQTYHEQISAQEFEHAIHMQTVCEHARALGSLGAWPEVIVELEKARAMIGDPTEANNAVASWETAFELGRAHRKLGDQAAAERELVRALSELRALYSIEAPPHADALYELGELDLDRQRWSEAREHLEAAESIYAKTAETDYLPRARTRFALARALTGTAKLAPPEARDLAQAAIRGLHANNQHDEARLVEAWLEATR